MSLNKNILSAVCLLAYVATSQSAIQYDAAANRIWVTDYPAAMPCTPERLAAAGRIFGWNFIHYDPAQAAWRLEADLCIGADDGSDTFFQLGSSNAPLATLILNGNLFVCPSGTNTFTGQPGVNRLTLGASDNPNVSAVLKIASTQGNEHSIYIGVNPLTPQIYKGRPIARPAYSGQLHMFNSTITALIQDAEHAMGNAAYGNNHVFLTGSSIRLHNSEISWCKGTLAHGLAGYVDLRIENTVFAHGRTALSRYKETASRNNLITGCTFRDCGIALESPNHLVVMTGCRFENNRHNWKTDNCKELILIDCHVALSGEPDIFGITDFAVKNKWRPKVVLKRHVPVTVKDESGKPVAGAAVKIVGRAGRQGWTVASDRHGRADVLVIERVAQAVAGADQPEITECSYDIFVSREGYAPTERRDFRPWSDRKPLVMFMTPA